MQVPLINISDLDHPDRAVRLDLARNIGLACRSIGFFAITGHGVASTSMHDAFETAHAVFALPTTAKQELAIAAHGSNRGYVGLGVEALGDKSAPDPKEAYNLIWTDDTTRPTQCVAANSRVACAGADLFQRGIGGRPAPALRLCAGPGAGGKLLLRQDQRADGNVALFALPDGRGFAGIRLNCARAGWCRNTHGLRQRHLACDRRCGRFAGVHMRR